MSQILELVAADSVLVTAMSDFIKAYVAADMPVVRGFVNRVSKPSGPEYAVVTPMSGTRLATNMHAYDREAAAQRITKRTQRRVQVDFLGKRADVLAETFCTLLRDAVAVEHFKKYGIAPLYADDAQAVGDTDGGNQWTGRWTVNAMMQMDATASLPQDYFDNVNLSLHPQA